MNQIGEPTDNYLKRDKCRIFWIETPVNGAVPVTIDHDGHDRRRCEQNMKRWFINKAKTKTMMEFSVNIILILRIMYTTLALIYTSVRQKLITTVS